MNTSKIAGHIKIARVDHWMKNVFVLPGVVLAWFYSPSPVLSYIDELCAGLIAISLVASSNYTINELLDARTDAQHPTKRFRPVPSGQISIPLAWVQWLALFVAGAALASLVSTGLVVMVTALWLMGLVYNVRPLRSKEVPWVDVLTEAINNPIRLLAGWYIVDPVGVFPSASLLLSYWFVGAFFMALKRFAELRDFNSQGKDAAQYRASFKWYTEERLLTASLFHASAAMLFFGAFLMRYRIELILSFPFVAYVMMVYFKASFVEDSPVKEPEKLYRCTDILIATALCLLAFVTLVLIDLPWLGELTRTTMPDFD